MKKTSKTILGIFGLVAVVVMTLLAAILPSSNTSAIDGVTDTVVITVVNSHAWIKINNPSNDAILSHPQQTVEFEYGRLRKATAQLIYTDDHGTTHTVDLGEIDLSEDTGTAGIPIDLSGYGYGDMTIKVAGEGIYGDPYEDAIAISYYPVTTTIEQDPDTEDVYANLDYDLDNPEIDTLVLNIYDEKDPEKLLWTITVPRGTTKVELPFAEEGYAAGKYIITTTAYNANGEDLYVPYVVGLDYTRKNVPTDVPNTGTLTAGALNVSKSDFLVTSLIVLLIASFGGIYFVSRRKNSSKK